MLFEGYRRIEQTYSHLVREGRISTPFASNPAKQLEAVYPTNALVVYLYTSGRGISLCLEWL